MCSTSGMERTTHGVESANLDEEEAVSVVQDWYTRFGPFAGKLKLSVPLIAAFKNSANGHMWSFRYKVERDGPKSALPTFPEGVEEDQVFFVQFQMQPKPSRGGRLTWSVVDFSQDDATEAVPRLSRSRGGQAPLESPRPRSGSAARKRRPDTGSPAPRTRSPPAQPQFESAQQSAAAAPSDKVGGGRAGEIRGGDGREGRALGPEGRTAGEGAKYDSHRLEDRTGCGGAPAVCDREERTPCALAALGPAHGEAEEGENAPAHQTSRVSLADACGAA